MTTETVYMYSGLQNAVAYELNAMGRPKAAAGGLVYVGLEVHATKVYNLTLPAPRRIPHIGNDRLLATQIFPSQESATGELNVGSEDLDLIAALTGLTIKETAGLSMLPHLTDNSGKEPNVGFIFWQAALSKRLKKQGIHFHIVPSTKAVPRIAGAGENPVDLVFDLAPNPSEYHLWGEAVAPLADVYDPLSGVSDTGAFESGVWSGFSDYPNRIAAFIAAALQTEFLFPASRQAISTTNVAVFSGAQTDEALTEVSAADYTVAADGVTFDIAPGVGKEIQVVYQHK
jgi:hypothetical protein